jgi:mRNA-degrading endonuclease RelE of RelBE toxin-antitoxin system
MGLFWIRAGNYRILNTVDGSNLIVEMDEIGNLESCL